MKLKPKLWGVWLSNHTDMRDDEWVGVMATSAKEARENASFNFCGFSIKDVAPAKVNYVVPLIPQSNVDSAV